MKLLLREFTPTVCFKRLSICFFSQPDQFLNGCAFAGIESRYPTAKMGSCSAAAVRSMLSKHTRPTDQLFKFRDINAHQQKMRLSPGQPLMQQRQSDPKKLSSVTHL